nr:hypothetical protein [Tanacetum cinerariifolium]GFB09378.1 hypothetical protein [Tanacetum cinerariifolium]
MDIEEEEPEEEPVEEPKPLAGHGDQFDAHPNPQPGNMNGWVDDNDDVEEEDEENEDAEIEGDDDAEIIFPYEEADDEPEVEEADNKLEVEEDGVEPEAEGADVELEAEEPDGVSAATIGTGSQRPFAVLDFPMGFYKAGESSTARDPQFVGGLAPWALRRDLETLRRHERIREAESETSRTEVALLGSEAKVGKIEREMLHHDLSGVEETLGKMVHKGAVPKPPSDDEGPARPRKTSKKSDGDEGPSNPHGPLMIMPPKPMSEARIRDQFATSMNEFMAKMNNRAVDLEELVARVEQVALSKQLDLVVPVEMLMELVSEVPDRLYLN